MALELGPACTLPCVALCASLTAVCFIVLHSRGYSFAVIVMGCWTTSVGAMAMSWPRCAVARDI